MGAFELVYNCKRKDGLEMNLLCVKIIPINRNYMQKRNKKLRS